VSNTRLRLFITLRRCHRVNPVRGKDCRTAGLLLQELQALLRALVL